MFFVVTNWFEDSQYRTGQPRKDSWDKITLTGQARTESGRGQPGQDSGTG
jgi:hypothetical protein